ncbi:MAG: lactate utilization protein C [Fimbriimonas sp.]
MDAKTEVIERIRRASVAPVEAERVPVRSSQRERAEVIDQFAEYVAEYRATVVRVGQAELSAAVKALLHERGSERVVVPANLPVGWCDTGIVDEPFTHRELADMQAVVTSCALGIAESGTIVLDAGPGQGRRALSLIPDHHICVIRENQIVDTMPEAVALLQGAAEEGRPLTWISGPSATSDIELSRVEGVHGPRILDVIIVGP